LVVVQVLSPEAVANEDYFERVQEEINVLHELEHPNLVRIRPNVPPRSGPPYLVSDYEAGGTLMDQLREQGTMSIAHVAQLGLQLCEGLRAAHRSDMLHGDLNPDRILLDHIPEAGEPPLIRIADFGSIKTQGSVKQGFDTNSCSLQYAAPERVQGDLPSREADIYSIGSVMLFAVSLQPLISNAERIPSDELIERLDGCLPPRWKPPPGLELDASQVAFFNAVLNATMAMEPEDRCSLDEVQQYLEALLEVEDEAVFEAPEIVEEEEEPGGEVEVEVEVDEQEEETPEAPSLTAESAIAHFNAFSSDPGETDEVPAPETDEATKQATPNKETKTAEPGTPRENAEEEGEEAPVEEEVPKPPRDWLLTAWHAGQAASVLMVLMIVVFVFVWNFKPHILPPAWLEARGPTPLDVVAGDHKTHSDYQSIVKSLNAKKGRLRKCGLVQDSLSIYVVVEPNGKVRAGGSSYLPKSQRVCVRRKLLGMVLKRRSTVRPLRIRTTLLF